MTSSTSSSEPGRDQAQARPAPPAPDPVPPPVRIGPLQGLLAVLLPVLIIGAVVSWWWRPAAQELSDAAVTMDSKLAAAQPEVVVLGNSIAWNGIDPDALGKSLGDRTVLPLTVFASPPPTWFAVLKNRVLAGGYHPDIVLVVGTMSFFTMTDVNTELQKVGLADQSLPDEPVIAGKTFGSTVGRIPQRVNQRRSALRERLIEDGRLSLLSLVEDEPADVAAEASDAVFEAEGALDFDRKKRVIPVVEVQREEKVSDEIDIDATYVPDLVRLSQETGAHVVFVKAPLPPSTVAKAPPQGRTERALVAWLNEHGAGYLDLSGMGLGESFFRDGAHLNKRGRQAFTAALGQALAELGATGQGELAAAALPVVAEGVRRDGEPPVLAPLPVAEARVEGPCLAVVDLPDLAALSSSRLRDRELWNSDPLYVVQDGEPLGRLAKGQDFDPDQCLGAFEYRGKELRISPRRRAPPEDGGNPLAGLELVPTLDPVPFVTTDQGRRWHWIYGGTTLAFSIAEGLDPAAGSLKVMVELDGLEKLEATEPLAWLTVATPDGVELAREPMVHPSDSAPGVLIGELSVAPPTGPFEVGVVGSDALTAAVLRGLGVGGSEGALDWIVGTDSSQSSLRLLGGKSLAPDFEGQAVALAPGAQLQGGEGSDLGRFKVPELQAISRYPVKRAVGQFNCSPVFVYEDGQALPHPHAKCKELEAGQGEPGSSCHEGNKVLFRTTDGSSPTDNGRSYSLGLDPVHTCKSYWWLHPGETLVRQVGRKELRGLRRGADVLVLTAIAPGREAGGKRAKGKAAKGKGGADAPIELRLADKDHVYLRTQLQPDELDGRPLRFPLDGTVTGAAKKLRIKLIAPKQAPHVLVELAVLESSGAP